MRAIVQAKKKKEYPLPLFSRVLLYGMGKQSLEIDRVLVCSTSHITAEDNQSLFDEETGLVVYEMGEYGWLILARPIDASEPRKHSDTLEKLLAFTRKHRCDWLRLDRDANEIEGLETFEW